MSSEKRKAQRRYVKLQLLKEKGNTHGFKDAWEDYRRKEIQNSDGTVTTIRQKQRKKKHHFDNGKVMIASMRRFKAMIANMKNKKAKEINVEG